MAAVAKTTLFTSIPAHTSRPVQGRDFGEVWQKACIDSWKAEGFHVVSLNGRDEIGALERFASSVDIIELPAGRQRPLITDFFVAIEKSGSALAGVANADCLLLPGGKLAERLTRNVDGVAMAERLNINQTTLHPTGRQCYGFDAFFFKPAAMAAVVRDDNWRIGDTWWDYWLPLAFHFAGVQPRTLPAPLLAHLDHEQAWNQQAWEDNGRQFFTFLHGHMENLGDPNLRTAVNKAPKTATDILNLSFKTFDWLRSREPLWLPEQGSADDLLMRLFAGLATPPEPAQDSAKEGRHRVANTLRSAFRPFEEGWRRTRSR